jgi:hypothetical protein
MLNFINLSNDTEENIYTEEEAREYFGDDDLILIPLSNEDMREYAGALDENNKSLLVVWHHAFWGLVSGDMNEFEEKLSEDYEISDTPAYAVFDDERTEKFPIEEAVTIVPTEDGAKNQGEKVAV